ncbi:MAG TPA: hypothetical protein VF529_10560 [Solirubrobacteraceae bacterium]
MRRLALIATVALAVLAVPASASAAESFSCTFPPGHLAGLTPTVPPAPTTGGAGTYDAGGAPRDAHCVVVARTGEVVETTATFQSTGRYENDLCGTGRFFGHTHTRPVGATGPGTYIDFHDPRVPDVTQLDYRVDFFGFHGALRGGNLTTKDGSSVPGSLNNDAGWGVTGYVVLRPANTGGCVTASVAVFAFGGHIEGWRP